MQKKNVSRRDFLKMTGAAGLAVAAGSLLGPAGNLLAAGEVEKDPQPFVYPKFKQYTFYGDYREVGRQYGECFKERLQDYAAANWTTLTEKNGFSPDDLNNWANQYYDFSAKWSEGLCEQLRGMAEGAGITAEDAMLIQITREIQEGALPGSTTEGHECTAFAVCGSYTKNGAHFHGQNNDNSAAIGDRTDIITFAVKGKPRCTFVLPLGYLSFHGMNSEGIGIAHNLLYASPWKFGLPRMFISRLALENRDWDGVIKTMDSIDFISGRTYFLADRFGNICCYEGDSQGHSKLTDPELVCHTNHIIDPDLKKFETREDISNSEIRLARIQELMEENKGNIDENTIKTMLSDHGDGVNTICNHDTSEDGHHGSASETSMINCLDDGVMLVSHAWPCEHEYVAYDV